MDELTFITLNRDDTPGYGLTNQIISLVTLLVRNIHNKKRIIILNKFRDDYNDSTKKSCISDIFDLEHINNFIKKYTNTKLYDNYKIDFKVLKFYYGDPDNMKLQVDLTEELIPICCKEKNTLKITRDINFNNFKGDPSINVPKKLTIIYSIDQDIYFTSVKEIIDTEIDTIFGKDINYIFVFQWINFYDRIVFDDIFKNIKFNKYFEDKAKEQLNKIINNHNIKCCEQDSRSCEHEINVIHLRTEDDMIEHIAKVHNISFENVKNIIIDKYIEQIKIIKNKKSINILLTYMLEDRIKKFLDDNGYYYYYLTEKLEQGRERNGLVDLILGTYCNSIYIGNFNVDTLMGSSFSYYIYNKLPNTVKKILISYDDIIVNAY